MTDRDFFDTNVLIYAIDRSEPEKQSRARALLRSAVENGTGVLSAQVLGEFFTLSISTSPRHTRQPISRAEAEQVIERLSVLPVIPLDLPLVQRAVSTCQRYQISYWDALIIAAAERANCTRIFSEDLNTGQEYNGVVVFNPF